MAENESSPCGWEFVLMVALIGMALQKNAPAMERRLVAWEVAPVTAAGVAARAAYRRLGQGATLGKKACLNVAVNLFAKSANPLRPGVGWFGLLSLGVFLCPLAARRMGSLRYWNTEWLAAAVLVTGAGACFGLAMPAAWPWPVLWVGGVWAFANTGAALFCLCLAIWSFHKGSKRLHHGPAFKLPMMSKPCSGFTVGRVDPKIMPGHSRWLASGGGDIQLPFNRLSCGLTVLGEKGAGKSRLLFAIHDAIRRQHPNVPILIHDPKSEWYRTYYDPKADLFFAPHFKGTAAWSLWRDFREVPELRHELLSTCVYAHQDRDDTFWMDQAVDLLHQVSGFKTLSKAADYLGDIPHQHPDDEFLLSVFGTAKLGFLDLAKTELMSAISGARPLSIDDFLRQKGRIILLNNPSCASEQKGAFSLFLSAFLLRALSLPDVPEGTLRAVAIIDEALTFNLPPDVERRISTLCRSKGVCVVAGAQRLPDRQRNERGEWRTAEHTFAMKCVNQDTQRELSRKAGSLLFRRMAQSTTTSASERAAGQSHTRSEQDLSQEAIPPEHFGRLSPREFVLFHDQGIVTGRTVEVGREQRAVALPPYELREDVRRISMGLIADMPAQKEDEKEDGKEDGEDERD
ncbi:MAG: type IV secretion system DNA-binding domain-containing protein [Elusimicrobia bacterium]|nr:type IV secretion system DNA-binding domain-containing protein [Elusimicrobiota bacterium]